ncbi:MAG: site-specific integrase [Alphaproteobacteria bacterium]|nr:site-specific integrase [Alphaproteobacteria bacterium]
MLLDGSQKLYRLLSGGTYVVPRICKKLNKRAMPNLIKTTIDKLTAQSKDYMIWDDKISGFGVKVTPTGRKVYLLKYRTRDGRQRKPTIGIHGNITCEIARDIAKEWHAELAKGNDPAERTLQLRHSPTISDLCDRFRKEYVEVHKKASGHWIDDLYIEKYIKPALGTYKTISLSHKDVVKFHLSMKDTPVQANRIVALLSKMFSLAESWDLRPPHSNPVQGLQKYKEEKKERYLSEDEIQILIHTLDKAQKDESETIHFVSLIKLLLLTGARLSEIKDAKWDWVDLKTGLLSLPDSKTGKKVIHLSPAALEILSKIPRNKNNPYIIIGGIDKKPLNDAKKPWARIKARMAMTILRDDGNIGPIISKLEKDLGRPALYAEIEKEAKKQKTLLPKNILDVRLHDLRHTYASLAVGQGLSLQMVSKLLGHSDTRMTERYAHLAKDQIGEAAATIGNLISKGRKNA